MKPFRTAPIEVLHEKFVYDASTGLLQCKATGRTQWNFSKGYLKVSIKGASIPVHRVAWAMHYGEWPTLEIDHKDREKSNNRIDNLRQATRNQNIANVGSFGALASKGVSYDAKLSKFRALIKSKGVSRHIGHFDTEDEAAHAYNKEAIRVHGEFAVLNPIGEEK